MGKVLLTIILILFIFVDLSANDNIIKAKNGVKNLNKEKEELNTVKKKLTKLQERYNEDIKEKDKLIKEKNRLIEELKSIQDSKERLSREKQKLINSMQSTINNNNITREQQRVRLAELNGQVNSLNIQIDEKNKNIKDKEVIIKSKENNILAIKNGLVDKQKMIDDREGKITELKINIQKLETTIDLLKIKNLDKRKWLRIVQGIGFYKFRTPKYELQPKSSSEPNILVISNTQTGSLEGDVYFGLSIMMFDFDKNDLEQRLSIGPFVGFGGRDLFKNFYFGIDFKIYMIHINTGINFHQFNILKSGFELGDELKSGQTIPTTEEWIYNFYLGFAIDIEFLSDMLGAAKK